MEGSEDLRALKKTANMIALEEVLKARMYFRMDYGVCAMKGRMSRKLDREFVAYLKRMGSVDDEYKTVHGDKWLGIVWTVVEEDVPLYIMSDG